MTVETTKTCILKLSKILIFALRKKIIPKIIHTHAQWKSAEDQCRSTSTKTFHWNSGTKTLIRSNMIIAVLLYLIRKSCLVDHFCCLLFLSINGKFHNYSHKWSNSHLTAISAIMSQNADGYVTFVLPIVFSAYSFSGPIFKIIHCI